MSSDVTEVAGADRSADRARIVEATIVLCRAAAFSDIDLARVARQARLPLAAVEVWFPDLDALMIETIEEWNQRRMRPLRSIAAQQGAAGLLRGIVVANILDPGLMRLMAAMVNIAATPAHPLAHRLQDDWLHFHASIQRLLIADIAEGREPDTMDPARGAEQLIALYEGLQVQAMVRPQMDLLGAFDRAVSRLRTGWATAYTAPTWGL